MKALFAGCGFLTSHYILDLLPHLDRVILLDRERLEKENLDNYIAPVGSIGKRKVAVLASFLQILSPIPVTVINQNVKTVEDLKRLHRIFEPDIVFLSFDNLESRILVKDYVMEMEVPAINVGVTENYVMVDWVDRIRWPEDPAEIERVKREISAVRKVCSRLEFRGLGALSSALVYYVFRHFLDTGNQIGYIASTTGNRITLSVVGDV